MSMKFTFKEGEWVEGEKPLNNPLQSVIGFTVITVIIIAGIWFYIFGAEIFTHWVLTNFR